MVLFWKLHANWNISALRQGNFGHLVNVVIRGCTAVLESEFLDHKLPSLDSSQISASIIPCSIKSWGIGGQRRSELMDLLKSPLILTLQRWLMNILKRTLCNIGCNILVFLLWKITPYIKGYIRRENETTILISLLELWGIVVFEKNFKCTNSWLIHK